MKKGEGGAFSASASLSRGLKYRIALLETEGKGGRPEGSRPCVAPVPDGGNDQGRKKGGGVPRQFFRRKGKREDKSSRMGLGTRGTSFTFVQS